MEIEAEGDSTDGEDIEMDCATVREPVEAPAVSPVCVVLDAANIGWSMSKNAEFDAVGVVAALHFFKVGVQIVHKIAPPLWWCCVC